jgi:AAA domain
MLPGGEQLDLDFALLLRLHGFPDCTTRRPRRQGRGAVSPVLPAPIPDDQLVPWWEWKEGKRPPGWVDSAAAPRRFGLDDFNDVPAGPLGDFARFAGLTYAEARRAEIPETNELVAGLVDAGTVGLVAGLPFARKSWAALELAHKVAAGRGEIFGRFNVVKGGPVLYVWQDDSLPKELERLQAYAARHHYSDELPLRFLLNEGVQLPDDIDALAALMEDDGAVLLIVDSLYNALGPSVKLKEEEVAIVLARVKAGICDRTGATAGLVDHAPWPTEGNRGQRRAYGSVFKTAAVRWSIHLEADAKDDTRLHVEASGNNVAGFRRTPAIWNEEALEIRLLEVERLDEDTLDELVLAWVTEHPGTATTKVAAGVGKRRENVADSLERLGRLEQVTSKPSRELGRPGTGTYWFPFNHEGSEPSLRDGTSRDDSGSNSFTEGEPSQPSHPRRGDGSPDESVESEDLAWR